MAALPLKDVVMIVWDEGGRGSTYLYPRGPSWQVPPLRQGLVRWAEHGRWSLCRPLQPHWAAEEGASDTSEMFPLPSAEGAWPNDTWVLQPPDPPQSVCGQSSTPT